jgi:hypothetical protein
MIIWNCSLIRRPYMAWPGSGRGEQGGGGLLARTVLLLVGGAVGDRFRRPPRHDHGDTVMLAVAAVLAAVSWRCW